MKRKNYFNQMVWGLMIGVIIGAGISYYFGVDAENTLKNHLSGMIVCLVLCLLNCTFAVYNSAKVLKRKASIIEALIHSIPEIIFGAAFGMFFHAVILASFMHVNTYEFSRICMTILNTALGVIVSLIMGFFAAKSYEKTVKYTKRDK